MTVRSIAFAAVLAASSLVTLIPAAQAGGRPMLVETELRPQLVRDYRGAGEFRRHGGWDGRSVSGHGRRDWRHGRHDRFDRRDWRGDERRDDRGYDRRDRRSDRRYDRRDERGYDRPYSRRDERGYDRRPDRADRRYDRRHRRPDRDFRFR